MKKQNVVQGTFILVVAGLITKVLGMVNRVMVTRLLGEDGIGVYMLIGPTLMLLTTFASIGLPIAIPTLISRATERQKRFYPFHSLSLWFRAYLSVLYYSLLPNHWLFTYSKMREPIYL